MNTKSRKQFRVAFFGHSYVRDLRNFLPKKLLINDVEFDLSFITVPGGTFHTFLDNKFYFDRLKEIDPHFTFVFLGGNDLRANAPLRDTSQACTQFYWILRDYIPKSCIIGSEIENRFYKPNNRFGWPTDGTFNRMRQRYNRIFRRCTLKDFVLRIEGPDLLDHQRNYRDGVHLNQGGLRRLHQLIVDSLIRIFPG